MIGMFWNGKVPGLVNNLRNRSLFVTRGYDNDILAPCHLFLQVARSVLDFCQMNST